MSLKQTFFLVIGMMLFGSLQSCKSNLSVKLGDKSESDKSDLVTGAANTNAPKEVAPNESASESSRDTSPKLVVTADKISFAALATGGATSAAAQSLVFNNIGANEVYVTPTPGCIDGGIWAPTSGGVEWTGLNPNQLNAIYLKFRTASQSESECLKIEVLQDSLPPTIPTGFSAADNGVASSPTTSPMLNWSASVDSGAGVDYYELALGSSSGLSDLKSWQNIGQPTSASFTGLTLIAGTTVHASVRSVDKAGNKSNSTSVSFLYPGDVPRFDTSFNGSGWATAPVGSTSNLGYRIGLQTDGKIVVNGNTGNGAVLDIFILRYLSTGALDLSFGTNGVVTTPSTHTTSSTTGMALQSDNKIIVAQNDVTYMKLYRYSTAGVLDTSFGAGNGIATLPLVGADTSANSRAVGVAADGKIVITGGGSTSYQYITGRFDASGALDTTFGGTGAIKTTYASTRATGRDVLFQPDGKIILAGMNNYGNCFTVVRMNSDGTLDTGFNTTGLVCQGIVPGGGGLGGYGRKAALQADGKIVVVGYHTVSSVSYWGVIRLNADGTLDTSFNTTGKLSITAARGIANDLHLYGNGKILVGGYSSDGTTNRHTLIRLNSDGSDDSTFNNGSGIYQVPLQGDSSNVAFGMAVQPNGRVLLWGNMTLGGITEPFLTRTIVPNP